MRHSVPLISTVFSIDTINRHGPVGLDRKLILERQIEGEGSTLLVSGGLVEAQLATMGFDDAFGDVEAEPRTFVRAAARETTEGAEKLFNASGGNTHAFIMHADVHFTGCLNCAYRDGGIFVRVFDGVIHQVAQRLLEPVSIPVAHNR